METNNVTQWAIIGAAVLVLIIGGVWLSVRGTDAEPEAMTNEQEMATTTPATTTVTGESNIPKGTVEVTSDGESVVVENQAAGDTVAVQSMELTRASWVAVRDDRSILGAAWFPSSAQGGVVKLQRVTESGKTYRVVMYVDDGDKKFDFKADKLITANGAPVGTSFTAN